MEAIDIGARRASEGQTGETEFDAQVGGMSSGTGGSMSRADRGEMEWEGNGIDFDAVDCNKWRCDIDLDATDPGKRSSERSAFQIETYYSQHIKFI